MSSTFPLCPLWLRFCLLLSQCLSVSVVRLGFWLWLRYDVSSVVEILRLLLSPCNSVLSCILPDAPVTSMLRFLCCTLLTSLALAQQAPVVSPEVHADNTVTFRFRDPNAKAVLLDLEGQPKPVAMEIDDKGIWSVTTASLGPDYYGYAFTADGVSLIDPSNWLIKPNFLHPESMVHIAGPTSLPWEINDVPRGEVHHHFYHSAVAGDDRDYYVYTPPAYDPKANKTYPVLYLLHGFSDDASGWTAVGRDRK